MIAAVLLALGVLGVVCVSVPSRPHRPCGCRRSMFCGDCRPEILRSTLEEA